MLPLHLPLMARAEHYADIRYMPLGGASAICAERRHVIDTPLFYAAFDHDMRAMRLLPYFSCDVTFAACCSR